MPLNVEMLSLISAVQAAVLALMLWTGTQGDPGRSFTSLRVRAAALALEATGWGMLAFNAYLTPLVLLLGGNAINLLAQGMSVIALRMLLGESLRWRLVVAVGVVGWLGVAWLGAVEPNYRLRVLWGSCAILVNLLLSIEALRGVSQRRHSRARTVLLVVCGLSMLLLFWRNGQLWLVSGHPGEVSVSVPANTFYVLLTGLQPLFASIGFLLLYNETLQLELHQLARIDPLTGVYNRLAIGEVTTRLLVEAAERRQTLSVLMLDVDHFKSVNDRFGHAGGDKVLRALVSSIATGLREYDVLGRVGGEEFVVLLPRADREVARALGERVRRKVESMPMLIDGTSLTLIVSVGVSVAAVGERDGSAVLLRADRALYAAKGAGRNQVVLADDDSAMRMA